MNQRNDAAATQRAGALRSMAGTVLVAVFMGGLAFAAVPLYDWFCRVTGFAGTTQVADAAPGAVGDHTVRVFFDANTHNEMPWEFRPKQTSMTVRLGEPALAYYEVHNPTDYPITGSATFNVAPLDLGGYFAKVQCFCFTETTLEPGETMEMPVSFFVDPEILEDEENKDVTTFTLSYTFFRIEQTAAVDE
ncbi:MAG: cytochrome c oxidase assembly protein [Pseudomonadota bacterium]